MKKCRRRQSLEFDFERIVCSCCCCWWILLQNAVNPKGWLLLHLECSRSIPNACMHAKVEWRLVWSLYPENSIAKEEQEEREHHLQTKKTLTENQSSSGWFFQNPVWTTAPLPPQSPGSFHLAIAGAPRIGHPTSPGKAKQASKQESNGHWWFPGDDDNDDLTLGKDQGNKQTMASSTTRILWSDDDDPQRERDWEGDCMELILPLHEDCPCALRTPASPLPAALLPRPWTQQPRRSFPS